MQKKSKNISTKSTNINLTIIALLLILLNGYFSYHAIRGPRGWYAAQHKKRIVRQMEELLSIGEAHQKMLQNKVLLLQQNIDADLLEQYAWMFFRSLPPQMRVWLLPSCKP